MVGMNFFAYSQDKGNTWSILNLTNSIIGYKDIYFKDTSNGWIINSKGWQIKTTDGGNNWDIDSSSDTPQIYLATGSKYYSLLDNGEIAISNNQGLNWDTISVVKTYDKFNSIFFSDSLNGVICSEHLGAYITKDGGKTWSVLYDKNNVRATAGKCVIMIIMYGLQEITTLFLNRKIREKHGILIKPKII